ncbi:MAG: M48 family metalloprotease [Kiloniellaceae bacterium]
MRSCRTTSLLGLVALLGAACATTGQVADIKPGEKPAPESVEAGLWMRMERLEEQIQTSGRLERDAELNAYLRGIVCKLAPDYCADIRISIVRAANFNASMAPNGAMHVWTGLMLRSDNEAQLAYVLGHELAHYLRRHTLKRWRDIRAKTDGLVFLQLATAMAGVGYVGSIAQIAALGSVFAFSRDQEREADRLGFEMMREAGYDPQEAVKIWDLLLAEKEAAEEPDKLIFFSTHPAAEERGATLADLAAEFDGGPAIIDRGRFVAATSRFRTGWLRDEVRERDFARMEVLLDHLAQANINPAELHFFRGELYRLRGEDDDRSKAAAAYEEALKLGEAPPETHRALGLVYWSMERSKDAREAFETYLRQDPGAEDRAMIESYIQQIQ